jgi:hypothetical protein
MKMKSQHLHVPIVALLFALSASGFAFQAGPKAKPPSDTPVTTTFDGLGVNTSPTLRVQSDQLGAYANSNSLQSIIQGIGDWELDMLNFNSSPQRKLLVDLRDPVPSSGPNGGDPIAPFAYQIVRARLISKCTDFGNNMKTIPGGVTITCPLALAFDDAGGVRYRLAMNPLNFFESNPVQITCVATDASSKCNQWKIEPSVTQLDGERKNVAKLLKVATKPRQTDQDMGDFYMSFTIHVTNP